MVILITEKFLIITAVVVCLGAAACGTGNRESARDPETGNHPAAWYAEHSGEFLKNQPLCASCHGTDFKGGISTVSCFSASYEGLNCHANGPSGHEQGWGAADAHGAKAKSAPDGAATAGFSSCRTCHGPDFAGGLTAASCVNTAGCHGASNNAPHPSAPWRGGTATHTSTDPGNSGDCALCHLEGRTPPSYALLPSGTQAGCFNNTLCHGSISHPAGWSEPTQHGLTAEQDFSVCRTCHGPAYQGGSAATTCFQCHDGPGLDHPAAGWVVADHKSAALADSTACRRCHGADYQGGGSHTACSSCHLEDQSKVHMLNWYPDVRLNHREYALSNGTTSCANQYCHGPNLAGAANSGPSCSTCHSWPFTGSACGSCHGVPPAGKAAPDRGGAHATHAGGFTTCDTCHAGAGSGTGSHQNGAAEVSIAATYNAKTGTASYSASALACSSVSCHGGQTTPGHLTESISVDTQCTACHAYGTTQFNSFNSGRHNLHVNSERFACTECHDTGKLAPVHFNDLNTSAMTDDWSTLKAILKYTGTAAGRGNCTVTCHGKEHRSLSW